MRLLLDTNVLSELQKPRPAAHFLEWMKSLDDGETYISVISLAEIGRGVALLDGGRRHDALARWLADELPRRFTGRVLSVGHDTALAWGELMANASKRGRTLHVMDGLIAATARCEKLSLATRNTRDFEGLGIDLINPWNTGNET